MSRGKPLLPLLFSLMAVLSAEAKDVTTEPVLRPNTPMHSGMIKRLDTDGKFIVTASKDKTAKLWDAQNGELLRTFRVPIDEGDEGKLYACAISPDGETVAVAGWTGQDTIFLFETDTGVLKKKVDGMGNITIDLEFSKDGRYLAAAQGANTGVKIIATDTWSILKALDGYGDNTSNICFDKNGRLATVSFDGSLRLYDSKFQLLRSVKTSGGTRPFNLAFSPDGRKLAVGYDDSSRLQVVDSSTLALLYEPDVTDAVGLNKVCWSEDGSFLYAGGTYKKFVDGSWWFMTRRYSNGGQGSYSDHKACDNVIVDLKAVGGDLLFAGALPDFGRMGFEGKIKFYHTGDGLIFTNSQFKYFRMASDSIEFKPAGKDATFFSLKDQSLAAGKGSGSLAQDSRSGVQVSEWEDSTTPKLNGTAVSFLSKYENSRSVSVADNGTLLWGTDWNLFCTDKVGKVLWKKPVPGTVWSVNTLGDVVTAAYDDGTIRWHRLSDGQELMALMVNEDMKRWVLWTPDGYYACSPGGQDLVGWHKNNGADHEADFFPASRFADRFYRPDILALIPVTKDSGQAVAQANAARNIKAATSIDTSLPPVVRILTPSSGFSTSTASAEITVSLKTLTPDPVTETKILINGRPYDGGEKGLRVVAPEGSTKKYTVKLEDGENLVSVLARNKNAWSEASTVRITKTSTEAAEFTVLPKLYILAVGVANYKDTTISLKYAAKDARDFAGAFGRQKGVLYRDVVTRVLTDEKATKDGILDGLDWIQNETTSKDLAVIYISGHGMNDSTSNLYYLPYDTNVDNLKRTGLPAEEVSKTIRAIAGKVIYFMDACHSGSMKVASRKAAAEIDTAGIANELSSAENGAIVFLSSTSRQYSLERDDWNNGAFTKAIVEGLGGKADYSGKGKITVKMLDLYISERVKELTGGKQSPTTTLPDAIRDFPIAMR